MDESLSKRIATELKSRGRTAVRISQLGWGGLKDPEILKKLFHYHEPTVFLTYDDHLPWEHAPLVKKYQTTLAIIDPRLPDEYAEEEWKSDIVHRWAHTMQLQDAGSIKRYSVKSSRPWKKPRRAR